MSKDIDLEIEKMIRASYNVVVFLTSEEGRAISIVNRVCEKKLDKDPKKKDAGKGRLVATWDLADGFKQVFPEAANNVFHAEGISPKPDSCQRSQRY